MAAETQAQSNEDLSRALADALSNMNALHVNGAVIYALQKLYAILGGGGVIIGPVNPHHFPWERLSEITAPQATQRALSRIQVQLAHEGPTQGTASMEQKLKAVADSWTAPIPAGAQLAPDDHRLLFGPGGPTGQNLIAASREFDHMAQALPAEASLRMTLSSVQDQLAAAGGRRLAAASP